MGIGEGALGRRFFYWAGGLSGGANGVYYVRRESMARKK